MANFNDSHPKRFLSDFSLPPSLVLVPSFPVELPDFTQAIHFLLSLMSRWLLRQACPNLHWFLCFCCQRASRACNVGACSKEPVWQISSGIWLLQKDQIFLELKKWSGLTRQENESALHLQAICLLLGHQQRKKLTGAGSKETATVLNKCCKQERVHVTVACGVNSRGGESTVCVEMGRWWWERRTSSWTTFPCQKLGF